MKHYEPKQDQTSRSGKFVVHGIRVGGGDGSQAKYEEGWERIFGKKEILRSLPKGTPDDRGRKRVAKKLAS